MNQESEPAIIRLISSFFQIGIIANKLGCL